MDLMGSCPFQIVVRIPGTQKSTYEFQSSFRTQCVLFSSPAQPQEDCVTAHSARRARSAPTGGMRLPLHKKRQTTRLKKKKGTADRAGTRWRTAPVALTCAVADTSHCKSQALSRGPPRASVRPPLPPGAAGGPVAVFHSGQFTSSSAPLGRRR